VSGRALLAALVEGRMDPATMSCPWAVTLLDTILGVDQRDGELMVAEGALPWRGLATRTAWRPGVAWRRATTKAPASRARDRPARATARGGRLQATGLCGGPHQRHVPLGRGSPTGRAPGENRAIKAVADSIVVMAFHRRSRHDPSRMLAATDVAEPRDNDLVNHWTRRMERLGYHVQLAPVPPGIALNFQ
jgi:transposase